MRLLERFRSLALVGLAFVMVMAPVQSVVAETIDVTVGVGETTVRIQGYTSPQALVTIMDGGTVVGSTVASVSGQYSRILTDQTAGIHDYQVFSEDNQGRVTDTITVSVNVVEHQQTIVDAFLPPTLALTTADIEQGEEIGVSGSTAPGAHIVIYIGTQFFTTDANNAGEWSYTIATSDLSPGEYQVYVVATIAGDQSYPSETRTFIVQEKAATPEPSPTPTPLPPPSTTPVKPRAPTITQPRTGTTIDGNKVTLRGKGQPGSQIEIWNNGRLIGSVFVDSSGNWSITITLDKYRNELRVRACLAGVCSAFSDSIVIIRRHPPRIEDLQLSLNRYRHMVNEDVAMSLIAKISGGKTPYRLAVEWGDGYQADMQFSGKEQSLSHTYTTPGKYNGRVIVTDTRGQQVQAGFSVHVAELGGWNPGYIAGVALVIAAVAVGTVCVGLAGGSNFLFLAGKRRRHKDKNKKA